MRERERERERVRERERNRLRAKLKSTTVNFCHSSRNFRCDTVSDRDGTMGYNLIFLSPSIFILKM